MQCRSAFGWILLLVVIVGGCGGGGEGGSDGGSCTVNPAPAIRSTPPTVATVGVQYAYATDAISVCLLIFTCGAVDALQLPPGAQVFTSAVVWTPAAGDVNTSATFSIATKTDICGNRATQSWSVSVHPAPVIESFAASRTFIIPGQSVMLTGVFQGSGQIVGLGPIASGVPIATPSLNVSTNFTLIVTNSAGAEVRQRFTIEVRESLSGNATGPNVIFANPANGAMGVAANTSLSATFSEHLDVATITSSTFLLNDGSNTPVNGSVTYAGQIATFAPASPLGYLAPYTATITSGVRDLAGNPLAANYVWSFSTGAAPDTTPPTVTSTSPANGAACAIPEDIRLLAAFSEFIAWNSMNSGTFILRDGSQNPVNGWAVGANGGRAATFSPATALANSMSYTASVTTGITDLAGNRMAADYSWTFTTSASGVGSWQPAFGLPTARSEHSAVWTGSEMIVWGGEDEFRTFNTGTRYNPATGLSQPMTTSGAPSARRLHKALWTGSEMIVWGGREGTRPPNNSGALYNPATDTWRPMSTSAAPSEAFGHTAVWTGSEMIVWGDSGLPIRGGRYSPATDTWQPMSASGAPEASGHIAVWTGSEMIVWGRGVDGSSNTGARYRPATDSWQPIPVTGSASGSTAVWTGSEMAVWGGLGEIAGALYNPTTQTWRAMTTTCAPSMTGHQAVWTGNEMIVWGGRELSSRGARYSPSTDTWQLMTTSGAPSGRVEHTSVWTGSEVIIWGGTSVTNGSATRPRLGSGGGYRP